MRQVSPPAAPATPIPSPSAASTQSSPGPGTFVPPTYTMKEIHAAIPAHCFHPSTFISLAYITRDVLLVLGLSLLALCIHHLPSRPLRLLAWTTYHFAQGLAFTGLWELAHECGHGALSKYRSFNNIAGLCIHSFLLVPYHSWRFTHQTHHKNTNNLARDIAFVPDLKEGFLAARAANPFKALPAFELIEDTPIVALVTLFFHQLIAFPIYLTLNNFALERMRRVEWWKRSHFYWGGDGPNFRPWQSREVLVSDIGIAVAGICLWAAVRYFGAWNVLLWYGVPYLWTNHWILVITYLQHTDPALPYYPPSTHTFLRGAASTIDRDFGWIGTHLFHGAINFHVLHHHASRIPFYHAEEASKAMRTVMGGSYIADMETNYIVAWWRNYRGLRWVEEWKGKRDDAEAEGEDEGSQGEGEGVYFFERERERERERMMTHGKGR